jgi:hypothetical protein
MCGYSGENLNALSMNLLTAQKLFDALRSYTPTFMLFYGELFDDPDCRFGAPCAF